MQKRKYDAEGTVIIILAWALALSLVYLVWIKFKLFFS